MKLEGEEKSIEAINGESSTANKFVFFQKKINFVAEFYFILFYFFFFLH